MEEGTTDYVGVCEYLGTRDSTLTWFQRSTERTDSQGNQHLMMHFYVGFNFLKLLSLLQNLLMFPRSRALWQTE